jgi:N12 class adenine-specific DNA methylase
VPGHCLAQASREFLQLYPTARILVADETNFVKDKRQRFLARAATAQWDCIIITHSAFKFIPCPAEFERGLIAQQIQSYSDLLERVDGADRLSRKRIERTKEGLEDDLERLKSHKDDMLTIAEIGVDQMIVDEMQEFRKLSFATNQTTLRIAGQYSNISIFDVADPLEQIELFDAQTVRVEIRQPRERPADTRCYRGCFISVSVGLRLDLGLGGRWAHDKPLKVAREV